MKITKPLGKQTRIMILFILLAISPILICYSINTLGPIINTTKSIPLGIYRIDRQGEIVTHSLIIFDAPIYNNFKQKAFKEVLGVPGDLIILDKEGVTIERESTKIKYPYYELGPVERNCPAGTIPPGYIFVGSSHPRSLDSRYYGLIPLDAVKKIKKVMKKHEAS